MEECTGGTELLTEEERELLRANTEKPLRHNRRGMGVN
jgi:hypothetical protein